jgi:hypothetical protein
MVLTSESPTTEVPSPVRPRRHVVVRLATALACAWAVPVAAHLLGVDWILPPLVLLGVASLLRSGRTLLDRMVLAFALLLGATCAAGLLISVWPWGLHPVPVAGFAFTGLIGIAAGLRRTPRLPLRIPANDWIVIGLSAAAAVGGFRPFYHIGLTGRLGIVAAGGDAANHFMLYDGIRHVGGYVFMHRGEASSVWGAFQTYPQGLHFIGALLASFVRSDAHQAPQPLAELSTFIWFDLGMFVMLCAVTLWAVRWLAGRWIHAWALLPVGTAAVAYVMWGDPLGVFWMGFWPELGGLVEFVILLAVLARPLSRTWEQVAVVASLFVAISFTYYLMLPIAGVAALLWLYRWRRRLAGRWLVVGAVAVVAAGLSAVMLVTDLTAWSPGDHLQYNGAVTYPDFAILTGLLLVALAGLTLGRHRRSPVSRSTVAHLVLTVAFCATIAVYHLSTIGHLEYFYYKSTHLVMLLAVLGLAGAARLLNAALPAHRVARAVPSLALAGAAFASLGWYSNDLGRNYVDGKLSWTWPAQVSVAMTHRFPGPSGKVTLVWGGSSQPATHWTGVLSRDYGEGWRAELWLPSGKSLTALIEESPQPVRIITDSPGVVDQVHAIQHDRPDLRDRVEVILVKLPPCHPILPGDGCVGA